MAIFTKENNRSEKVEYVNLVLSEYYDHSYRVMSDVWGTAHYAVVWDVDNNSTKHILLRVCDYAWSNEARVEVDATPEIVEAYHNFMYQRKYQQAYDSMKDQAFADAMRIGKGDLVQVKRGRKSKGVSGKVVVAMDAQYGMGYRSSIQKKLGIATSDKMVDVIRNGKVYSNHADMVWVWAHNCDKLEVPAVDLEAIQSAASAAAEAAIARLKAA